MARWVASSFFAICKSFFVTKRRSPELDGEIESHPMNPMYTKDGNSGRKRAPIGDGNGAGEGGGDDLA
jgi:hypothetical protein